MSFASTFSEVTLSLDFAQMGKVNSLIGTKPTKDSIYVAKDKYTLLEVIVPQYLEYKLLNLIKRFGKIGGTALAASKVVFPTTPEMVLREFRP